MFVTEGFHHVTVVSRDAGVTLHFYRDVLGLRLVKQTVNFDRPTTYHLYFGDRVGSPGSILTFFEWPDAAPGAYGLGGVHHIALSVPDEAAQLMWKRRLTDAGVPVSGPYNRGYFTSIYFRDPDGLVLEIATAGPGYATDEPADSLGQSVQQPPPAQLPGYRDESEIAALTHAEPVETVTPDMAITALHHVTGFTDDAAAAGEFYERTLGLKLIKRSVNQDDPTTPHLFWGSYDGQTVKSASSLTMFEWPERARRAQEGVGQTPTSPTAPRTRSSSPPGVSTCSRSGSACRRSETDPTSRASTSTLRTASSSRSPPTRPGSRSTRRSTRSGPSCGCRPGCPTSASPSRRA